MRARTSSGSCCSEAAVKPTRSQNSTETTFRSSTRRSGWQLVVSGAVQKRQKREPVRVLLAAAGQIAT